MFPKGIQFANKPWECAVTKFHQFYDYYPTSVIPLNGFYDVPGLIKLWETFINDLKSAIMIEPFNAYQLINAFLSKEFIESDIDSYTCLSSLLSAKCFNKHNELDIHTLGLLISVIKVDGRYSLSQAELINQLKQLTQFCTTISCDGQLIYNLSQFVPAHFLFNWIQLAYCLTIHEIAHNDKMDYDYCCYTTAIGFLFIIESKNVKQYDVFMKFIVDELWSSLKNFYLQAVDYLSKSSMITCNEELPSDKNDNPNQQNVTEEDIIDCYYEEFGRLLILARLTSNLNCPLQLVLSNQTLDKLTCLLFDRLATLCLQHSGITVHNHASVYRALFSVSTF
ncbi:unnamed protein product [Trichobilharzia regenti]|nr:unnamed protein product [Trichobilharzia regenti]